MSYKKDDKPFSYLRQSKRTKKSTIKAIASVDNTPQKRILTVYYHSTSNGSVPSILLQGRWLEKFGFIIGDKIEVEHKQESLIIRHAQIKEV